MDCDFVIDVSDLEISNDFIEISNDLKKEQKNITDDNISKWITNTYEKLLATKYNNTFWHNAIPNDKYHHMRFLDDIVDASLFDDLAPYTKKKSKANFFELEPVEYNNNHYFEPTKHKNILDPKINMFEDCPLSYKINMFEGCSFNYKSNILENFTIPKQIYEKMAKPKTQLLIKNKS